MTKLDSLYNTLNYYGFANQQQKDALENLMRQASIISPRESFQDRFPKRHDYNELVHDILEFVKLTQMYFVIRNGAQERWEIKPQRWMEEDIAENFQHLRTLGFVEEIKPLNTTPDAFCILGSIRGDIENRLHYAGLLHTSGVHPQNLILLAGERIVTLEVDGTKQELTGIARNFNIQDLDKLTETHLIQEAYKNSAFYNKIPTYVIDTPARNLPRPTTHTTILELVGWLKQRDNIRSITFVSNQPYVKYQAAIITEILRRSESQISFEVVGSGQVNKDNAQPVIEALGSYIYAQTPEVLFKLNRAVDDPKLIESFKELYSKQPFIYQDLENLFGIL
jgi:hypothetical protein